MAKDILMPQLGESVVEGTIAEWFVKEGQKIDDGDVLVEVETDKANTEVPATKAGYVQALLVDEGDTVDVGTPIIRLVDSEDELGSESSSSSSGSDSKSAEPETDEGEKSDTSDDKAAADSDSGQSQNNGGSTRPPEKGSADNKHPWNRGGGVAAPTNGGASLALASSPGGDKGSDDKKSRASKAPAREAGEVFGQPMGARYFKAPKVSANEEDTVTKFSRRRGIIAEHMVHSKQVAPHVPCFTEVDMTKVINLRNKHKGEMKKRGISLSFFAFILKATTEALREFPGINAVMGDQEIIERGRVNLGFAAETDAGLLVPVIKDADSLSVSGLAKAVTELADKARSKKITMDDLSGGTFTVSNPGRKGNLFGAAVINQPQSGILRMGEIVRRPVVRTFNGEEAIVIRSMMFLALTYDHRIIDGVLGNSFLHRVGELLEAADFQV